MRFPTASHLSTLSIVALVACAGQDKAPGADSTKTTSQAGAPADPPVVTIHAKDFAFEAPDSLPAGMTTFKLVNDGPSLHHMTIVRLDSGKTVADFQETMKKQGPPPAWAVTVGGPNAPSPPLESNATLDLQPGNYLLMCFVDVPDHVPHVAKGMVHPLRVTPSTGAGAATPTADVKVTLNEYAFQTSQAITSGSHTFEVMNSGMQDHELELVKLEPGKKVEDVLSWIQKPQGPPPGTGLGGAIVGHNSGPVYFTANFTPGDYAFLCFIPDAKDGKPHLAHGMMQTFSVK